MGMVSSRGPALVLIDGAEPLLQPGDGRFITTIVLSWPDPFVVGTLSGHRTQTLFSKKKAGEPCRRGKPWPFRDDERFFRRISSLHAVFAGPEAAHPRHGPGR